MKDENMKYEVEINWIVNEDNVGKWICNKIDTSKIVIWNMKMLQ